MNRKNRLCLEKAFKIGGQFYPAIIGQFYAAIDRILTSWNMHHAKPYVLDKRRPDDAETILKKI